LKLLLRKLLLSDGQETSSSFSELSQLSFDCLELIVVKLTAHLTTKTISRDSVLAFRDQAVRFAVCATLLAVGVIALEDRV